jgi:hypothetical protein
MGQGSLGTIKGGVPLWEAPPTLAGIWKNWTAKIVLRSGRPQGVNVKKLWFRVEIKQIYRQAEPLPKLPPWGYGRVMTPLGVRRNTRPSEAAQIPRPSEGQYYKRY